MEFEEQPLIPETQLKRYFALAQNGDWVIKLQLMGSILVVGNTALTRGAKVRFLLPQPT